MADVKDLEDALKTLSIADKPAEAGSETTEVVAEAEEGVFDRTMPSFAPFVDDERFIELEYHSPIALVNNNFLQDEQARDNFASVKARALEWCAASGVTEDKVAAMRETFTAHITAFNAQASPVFERIFIRDGERSFNTSSRRVALCHMLTFLQATTLEKDYHQGLSMIVSFLSLFLETPRVLCMVVEANTQSKFLPGIWKSQSLFAATDGYIFDDLLAQTFPAVSALFARWGIIPTLYISKWWCSMAIHVLPFQSLAVLFDRFWGALGSKANFELGLLIVGAQEQEILASKAIDRVLELLRFDPVVASPARVNALVYGLGLDADAADEEQAKPFRAAVAAALATLGSVDELTARRSKTFDEKLRRGVEKADKDFVNEDVVPNCARAGCENAEGTGDNYCLDCKKHYCDDCGYSTWEGHSRSEHRVMCNMDLDEEDLA